MEKDQRLTLYISYKYTKRYKKYFLISSCLYIGRPLSLDLGKPYGKDYTVKCCHCKINER